MLIWNVGWGRWRVSCLTPNNMASQPGLYTAAGNNQRASSPKASVFAYSTIILPCELTISIRKTLGDIQKSCDRMEVSELNIKTTS